MNKKSSKLLKRKSIRLKNFDYSSQGLYFITICVHNRVCLLGDIINGKMVLNDAGRMINELYLKTPRQFKNTTLDEYQIMPNHLHGIIVITGEMDNPPVGATLVVARLDQAGIKPDSRAGIKPAPTENKIITLGNIIGAFKSLTTHKYINCVKTKNWKPFYKRLWQRNYYEHIIRNENDLNEIREYIKNNPQMWDRDRDNPAKSGIANK